MKKKFFLLSILVVTVTSDLWSKMLARSGKININLLFIEDSLKYNRGTALSNGEGNVSPMLLIISSLTGFFLLSYLLIKTNKVKLQLPLMIVMGGTTGNLYERINYRHVTDFIYIKPYFICNLADIFIFLGLIIFFYFNFMKNVTLK